MKNLNLRTSHNKKKGEITLKKKKTSTMTWENAPDTIGVEELMEILGIGKNYASNIFNSKGFPKIEKIGVSLKADKEAARLFLQGFKINENSKTTMDYMILLELKKLNQLIERIGEKEND